MKSAGIYFAAGFLFPPRQQAYDPEVSKDSWDDETAIHSGPPAQPAKDPGRAYLLVLVGRSMGQMYELSGDGCVIGRTAPSTVRVPEEGISRQHAELTRRNGEVIIRDLGSTNGTFVNGEQITEHVLADGDKIQIGSTTILKFSFHDALDETFQRHMYDAALRDPLTRIFNKRHYSERLESEFAFARRHSAHLSLLILDIDLFKKVNDTHGHVAGDQVLTEVTRRVSATVRTEDVFARIGGEEFAVVCRGTDLVGATRLAERIRKIIADSPIVIDPGSVLVTTSVGVAAMTEATPNPETLQKEADGALYKAKAAGRNQVVVAG
jgi:two-component system, cell cycle response regulator